MWLHAEGEFPVLLVPFQEDAAATVTLRPYGFAALSAGLFVAF